MTDDLTIQAMQERRQEILTALTQRPFSPEELESIFSELAELSVALGPDVDDIAEAHIDHLRKTQTLPHKLTAAADMSETHTAIKRMDELIDQERRRHARH